MTTTLKRFLLFAGDNFYPGGGWADFRDSYDSLEEAARAGRSYEPSALASGGWWGVVDLTTGQEIADGVVKR